MARSRIHRLIAQALLGLLLFAWLPVMEGAGSPLLSDLEQALSLAELPDGAEADGAACRDAVDDGDGDPGDIALTGVSCRLRDGLAGHALRPSITGAILIAGLSGVPHATGPPSASP